MTTDNTTEQKPQVSQATASAEQAQRASRRKFLMQAGVGSLPVVMSLKSGDAWGCVTLACKGGEGNWSGTASAVQSVGQQKKKDFEIPQIFDSLAKIIDVVNKDLGIQKTAVTNGWDYLWNDLKKLRYKNDSNKYPLVHKQFKTTLSGMTATDINSWMDKVKELQTANKLYVGSYNSSSKFTMPDIQRNLLRPLIHNGQVIKHNTNMKLIFTSMLFNKELLLGLKGGNDFEKYFIAAFVGSIWQNCYIWDTDVGRRYTSQPDCYPKIEELNDAYTSLLNSSPSVEIAHRDLGVLFKAYTKTT